MKDYNKETLRVRNSFLVISSIFLFFSFIDPNGVLALGIKLENNNEKIVFVLFCISAYKSIYYLFRLINDGFMRRRLAFSGSRLEQDKYKEMADLVVTTDIKHDPYSYNILWDIHKKLDAISGFVHSNGKIKTGNLSNKKDSEIREESLHNLKELHSRYDNFKCFYKKENFFGRSLDFLFMVLIPYVCFGFASYFSWDFIYKGGLEFHSFLFGN